MTIQANNSAMKYKRIYPLFSIILVLLFTGFAAFSDDQVKSNYPLKTMKKSPAKKNAHGFWVNQEEEALKEATKLKKLILIDFFGIWCPPCNQLDELVFSQPEFKQAAKKFVLLKMDADSEKSWVLKSKYNVGGYPTIILAQVEDNQAGNEIDRIVGYYPTNVINAKMNAALNSDGKSNQEKLMTLIKKSIEQADEAQDYKKLVSLTQAGLALDPENLDLKLAQIKALSHDDKEVLKSKTSKKILSDIENDRKKMSVLTLVGQFEIKPSKEILDELLSRVNNSTLYINNDGFTEADLYALGIDLAESNNDASEKKRYTDMTVQSYEKLLKKYGEESRSLNLSYAYYLQKAGNTAKAEKVYSRMIAKNPTEFTFYYPAANMALETKDFHLAKMYVNKAVQYAYGDNQIRSQEKALKVAIAQIKDLKNDETKLFLESMISMTEKFVKYFKKPEGLNVRTTNYINKLNKTIDEAKALL
ncbi:MAG: thioredoxin family protein [Bdellovibrionaceae bacterium]|nr:thioredoxin family protein [Pseudobdellovibrionaceae bacterium]